MAATAESVATEIPATVTISGADAFGILVDLLRTEEALLKERDRRETKGTEAVDRVTVAFYHLAFGQMFRDCDLGTEEPDCRCKACNGDMAESATPIYVLAMERAAADPIKTSWGCVCDCVCDEAA